MIGQNAPVDPTVALAERLRVMEKRLHVLETLTSVGFSPAAITSGASAASNWTVNDFDAWVLGNGLMQFSLKVQRTTSAITQVTSGNIGNVSVATLPSSCQGNITRALTCPVGGSTGRGGGASYQPSTGNLFLTSLGGTTNLAIGEVLQFGGLFVVNES